MNDLRSPMEDRPYRSTPRLAQDDQTYSTSEYYRSKFDTIRQNRWFPIVSVLAAVLVFVGFISYAYKQGSQTGVNATTPVVEADKTDYKAKPANPGGMDVPFQDAVVFDQLQNKDQTAANTTGDKIESLLPPPEQPVAPTTTTTTTEKPTETAAATSTATETATPTATETTTAPTVNTAPATTATTTASATTPATTTTTTETTTVAATPEAKPLTAAAVVATAAATTTTETQTETGSVKELAAPKTTSEKAVKTAIATPVEAKHTTKTTTAAIAKKMDSVAPASAPATTKISAGTYRVQLGAFHDEAAAKSAWSKFQKEFNAQLAGVSAAFPRADLGAKGVFYRVQGVNLSKASADEVCRTINSAKSGSCIVTK